MPELADQPAPPLRTWRPMAAWTVGILLALGLVWFVGVVAVPVWQVRFALPEPYSIGLSGVEIASEPGPLAHEGTILMNAWGYQDAAIDRLGGQDKAIQKLKCYLKAPDWLAPNKLHAFRFLCWCGEPARPLILEAMGDANPSIRKAAIAGILANGCQSQERTTPPASVSWFPDGDDETRRLATARMETLLSDPDGEVRSAAAEALKQIRSKEASAYDGRYAVLPWDTFPEFGKIKPVAFSEMTLKSGSGMIKICYRDGSDCCIDVSVSAADEGYVFRYRFPAGTSSRAAALVPLRHTEGFLEMQYGRGQQWLRFARKLQEGERMPYPGWGCRPEEAWARGTQP